MNHLIQHLPGSCDSAAAIEQLAKQFLGDRIDHHVARPCIECDYMTGSRARWDSGKVGNAADVLYDPSYVRIAEQLSLIHI